MKTKLTLLLALLAFCVSGTWADGKVVTICDNSNLPSTYGSFSNKVGSNYGTFTTIAASGLSGVTITSKDNAINEYNYGDTSYKKCFVVKGGTGSYEIELEAPTGYIIADYSLVTMKTSTYQDNTSATVTTEAGVATTSFNTGGANLSALKVNAKKTKFTIAITTDRSSIDLAIAKMNITLLPSYETEVVICDNVVAPASNYGSFSDQGTNYGTFTTNAASGLAGVMVTSTNKMLKQSYYDSYKHCFALIGAPGTYSFTLSAPEGYEIVEYSLINMKTTTSSNNTSVTVTAGGKTTPAFSTYETTVEVKNIHTGSASFSITTSTNNGSNIELCIPVFKVVVASTVDYELYYNDSRKDEVTVERKTGESVSIPSSVDNGFMTYQYYSSYNNGVFSGDLSTVPSSGKIYVKATWNGPFDISEDYSTAKWYYMTLRGYWVLYNESTPWYFQSTQSKADKAQWAFMGNPYDGFRIINKEAGSGKYLKTNGTSASDYPTMSETATEWILGTHPASGFTFYYGTNNHLYAGDNAGNKFLRVLTATLTSSNDGVGGGSFTFDAVPDNFYEYLEANISPYMDNLGEYFGLNTSALGFSAMKSNYDSYVDAKSCTQLEYEAIYDYVTTLSNYNLPPTGYYRMKNHKYPTYYINASGSALTGTTTSTSAGTIVYMTKIDNAYTIQMQGKFIQTPESSTPTILSTGSVSFIPSIGMGGWVSFNAGGNARGNLHMDQYYDVVGWDAASLSANEASYWSIEPATSFSVTLNTAEDNTGSVNTYATLCVPFNITGLTGVDNKEVKAYAPTKSGDFIVPGDGATTINAGTPVLLIGEEGATSVTATIGSSYVTAPTTTNALTGVFSGQTIDTRAETGVNYVLGKDATNSNRIGFYHVNNENFALNANRAYLKLDGSGDPAHVKGYVISFDFDDDDATGVTSPLEETGEGASIYNLSGQRLNKMQKGINIVNGKKVLK